MKICHCSLNIHYTPIYIHKHTLELEHQTTKQSWTNLNFRRHAVSIMISFNHQYIKVCLNMRNKAGHIYSDQTLNKTPLKIIRNLISSAQRTS
ncbi:hypothetical protein CICLE_v10023069mg [Citrus x clementina]|uniref:Uncharacterized protein n=1 Tax=Citrus clementina TaxID=85681 RepID=V4TPG8_CITCL|nr:hypothetical protein CICLE_v10023069mg [Citrus x clementina]